MRLDGGKIKEVQVHLLLSSRAEMQKVIETARQTTIPAAAVGPQPVLPNQQHLNVKPQPSIITNNTLSGMLAQQMYQQHQMQIISQQQNMPLMTSTSVRHDAYSAMQNQKQQQQQQQVLQQQPPQQQQLQQPQQLQQQFIQQMNPVMNQRQIANENSSDSRDIQGDRKYSTDTYDRKRRDSRSRSKSRDRRDRRRSRSRGRRHRDRTRSRDRRRRRSRSRDRVHSGRDRNSLNRDRSRDRGRIRNRSYEKDDRKDSGNEINKSLDDQQFNKNVNDKITDIGTDKNSGIWENNDLSLNQNQTPKPYMGIMQNFSSVSVPFGSADSNKPISLFNNIYNQPAASDNNSKTNSFMSPNEYMPQHGSLSSPKRQQPFSSFEPVMPIIPFGGRLDPSRIVDNSRCDDIDDDNSDMVRCCIRVTNIGTNTHYSAVRRFFSGLHIPNDGVKLINDQYGNRIGVAVVRFLRPEVAEQALRRNQQQLNGNTINITIIPLQEYNAEEDSYRPPRNSYDRNRGGDFGNNNRMGGYNNRNFNDGGSDSRYGGYSDSGNDRNYKNDSRMNENNQDNMSMIDERKNKDMSVSQVVDDDDDEVLYVSDSNCNREQSSTLLVEDLPQSVTDEDVRKLFAKYTVVQIILPKVASKFHAYVKLNSAEEAQLALKDAYRIEYKPVFVSVCSEKIFEKILKDSGIDVIITQKPIQDNDVDNNDDDDMELVEDEDNDDNEENKEITNKNEVFPNDKTSIKENITTFTNDMENNEKQIQNVNSNDSINRNYSSVGGNNNNQAPAIPSLFDLNARNFGGPIGNQQMQYNSYSKHQYNNDDETKWIYIKNLEYRTVENEIGNWFADINLMVKRIFLLRNYRGQPSGECFCEFSSAKDARSALCKSRTRLGSRIIHLNLTQKNHVIQTLRTQNNINIGDEESNDENDDTVQDEDDDNNEKPGDDDGEDTKNSEDVEENIVEDDGNENDEDNYEGDDKDETAEDNNGNANATDIEHKNPFRKSSGGDANITDVDNNDEKLTNTINDQKQNVSNQIDDDSNNMLPGRGGNYMGRDNRSNYRDQQDGSNMRNTENNYNNRGNMGNNGNMMGMNVMNRNMANNNNNMNLDGRVVSIMNVPYRANTVDILQFFSGFKLTPDDVLRRYNDAGQPTGDARVRFLTPVDARKAVESMNNKRIMNRNVNLYLL